MMVIGDSLTSDIQGGVNAGIDTCWFNPQGKENRKRIFSYEGNTKALGAESIPVIRIRRINQ